MKNLDQKIDKKKRKLKLDKKTVNRKKRKQKNRSHLR